MHFNCAMNFKSSTKRLFSPCTENARSLSRNFFSELRHSLSQPERHYFDL